MTRLSVGLALIKAWFFAKFFLVQMSSLVSALRIFQRMAEEPPQEFKPDRKCKGPKSKAAKKKVRKNLTLDLSKVEGTKQVHFDEMC